MIIIRKAKMHFTNNTWVKLLAVYRILIIPDNKNKHFMFLSSKLY